MPIVDLHPIRLEVFMPHDYVFRVGELGEHLYIIVDGAVEIIAPDNRTVWATLR